MKQAYIVPSYCGAHNGTHHLGEVCLACTLLQWRDLINGLQSRVDDLTAENADLRRELSKVHHLALNTQEAHNRLAVHVPPDPELLP